MMRRNRNGASGRGSLVLAFGLACAACADKAEEPPAAVVAPVSAASSATPVTSAVATLPATSSDPVVLPPTVRGVLPSGFADRVMPEGAPMRVALVTPGAEPRAPMRYAYKLGASRTTLLLLHPEISREDKVATEMRLPDLAVRVTLTVGQRDAAGARIDGRFDEVRVASEIPKEVDRGPLDKALAAMAKLKIVLSVDDRGRLLRFETKGGDPADTGPAQLVERMKGGIGALLVPLPDEPIGIGATWQCVSRVEGGTSLLQFTTHKLASLAAGVFDVDSSATLFAVDDRLELPTGVAKVDEFSASAEGAARSSLDEVGVRSGHWDIRSAITAGSGPQTLKMSSKIHFEMSP